MYDVVQQLEALLIEYGPTNVTIGNFMYQAELDAFFRDGKEADFSSAPNVLDSLVYLDRTYYQYETEIDFPGLHIDCDSVEEEDLEDTLPYEEPPPPYHSVRNRQTNVAVAAQQSPLYVTTGRQSLLNDPLQAQSLIYPSWIVQQRVPNNTYLQPHPPPNGENILLIQQEVRLLIGILQEIVYIKLNPL